jgi:hypothetical protein
MVTSPPSVTIAPAGPLLTQMVRGKDTQPQPLAARADLCRVEREVGIVQNKIAIVIPYRPAAVTRDVANEARVVHSQVTLIVNPPSVVAGSLALSDVEKFSVPQKFSAFHKCARVCVWRVSTGAEHVHDNCVC